MATSQKKTVGLQEVCENLVRFSLDQGDIQQITERMAEDTVIKPVTMEYEIRILRMVSVGWGIAYFLEGSPYKERLATAFWETIREMSGNISQMSSAVAGEEIDYFAVIKDRIDLYVETVNAFPDAKDPGPVIGYTFAKLCGDAEDGYALIAGKRIFHLVLAAIKEYMESIEIVETT